MDTHVVEALTDHWRQQREAMVAGDAAALGDLLDDGYVLTHMTGYRQAREEWLDDVAASAMAYHSIADVDVSVEGTTQAPVLTVRTRTAATIWGAAGTWPLQLRTSYRPTDRGWLAAATTASTW